MTVKCATLILASLVATLAASTALAWPLFSENASSAVEICVDGGREAVYGEPYTLTITLIAARNVTVRELTISLGRLTGCCVCTVYSSTLLVNTTLLSGSTYEKCICVTFSKPYSGICTTPAWAVLTLYIKYNFTSSYVVEEKKFITLAPIYCIDYYTLYSNYYSLQAKYEELKKNHENLAASYQQLSRDYTALHNKMILLTRELEGYKARVSTLNAEFTALKAKLEKLSKAYNSTKQALREKEEELAALSVSYENLRANYTSLEHRYLLLNSSYAALKEKYENALKEAQTAKVVCVAMVILATLAVVAEALATSRTHSTSGQESAHRTEGD